MLSVLVDAKFALPAASCATPAPMLAITVPFLASATGAFLFRQQCSGCHGIDLQGFYNVDISPDGTRLAFIRTEDKVGQLAIIPADGGEAEIATDFDLGVTSFEWSPDGSSLAVAATTYVEEWSDLTDDERRRRGFRPDPAPLFR